MKAFYIDKPFESRFGSCPKPSVGADEIRVRIKKIGLCGSDLNTFRGKNPLVQYPRIPGHEIVAEIESIGNDVPTSMFSLNQLVTLNPYKNCGVCVACRKGRVNACRDNQTFGVQREGALAELVTVPWQKVLPTKLSDMNSIAVIEPLSVGFHAVRRAETTAHDVVAVFGCGVIGLGAIAGAKAQNAIVIAIDISDEKLNKAQNVGADHVINSSTTNLQDAVQAITNGDGVDVAIEAVGLAQTFVSAIEIAATTGRVVYIGYANQPVSYETKYFLMKELDIRGSRGAQEADFRNVIKYLEAGLYPVEETISHQFSFAESDKALQLWHENPADVSKILIEM